ncbi:sodium:solute symporter family protein [Shewanella surugensis]|uniref:Sodium:solute symporter family protein n=1 Tax=Shewanella surugensis TaxID=212020 RepID=A0ABT0LDW1_9GAMM|nr:sodium:solute symporter family protein [Shewanella surugensis]MCL1125888.1 sodium:solute symporter family protein [Shewanella surugensis]
MNNPLLNVPSMIFLILYLVSLIGIGILGKQKSKENTLNDFYLGGKSFGAGVLFLTLYATQYSGNNLIGFAGSAYRNGWFFLVGVTLMLSVIGGYMLYAPKLFRLSQQQDFITVGDFIAYRYQHKLLTTLIVIICLVVLSGYILSNLKAIGYIMSYVTGGGISFAQGIVSMALIMVIYETLGGMRSVAWTDAIQGSLLLVTILIIFAVIWTQYGSIFDNQNTLESVKKQFFRTPEMGDIKQWVSTLVMVCFGAAVYPQAIQRIYASKSKKSLQRSFQLMLFMPFFTTLPIIIIAIIGAAHFPNLDKVTSDQIILLMLSKLNNIAGMQYIVTLFVAAAIAAIMSTVDSAMLAIASLFTQDIYQAYRPQASQKKLIYLGKVFTWILIAIMAALAIYVPVTLWWLIQLKLEILCQIAPAIMLGVHFKQLKASSILWGLITGISFTLIFMFSPSLGQPFGIPAGVVGLMLNAIIVNLHHKLTTRSISTH